jgi:hypothetical protein
MTSLTHGAFYMECYSDKYIVGVNAAKFLFNESLAEWLL